MSGFWEVLGLEPTRDISSIKKAYARKTLTCHPEDNPAGFLELRKAYQAAMDYAGRDGFAESADGSGGGEANGDGKAKEPASGSLGGEAGAAGQKAKEPVCGSSGIGEADAGGQEGKGLGADGLGERGAETGGADAEADTGEESYHSTDTADRGWTLVGSPKCDNVPNPYIGHEAIRGFLALYTGKQRKDQKRWLDYFTSDAFLDIAWDRRFTALLLEQVTRLEGEYPVNREFLIWLCVAYQFTVRRAVYWNPDGSERTEYQFQIHAGARFDGQQSVFEIAAKGPVPKSPKGNELAVFQSFTEYRRLLSMAEENVWSEREIGEYSQIIGCYAAGYLTDKCQQRGDMDYERHPAGLRLMTHFFRRDGLPEELYRITWQRLNLETAVMGREKLFYGSLRGLILERMPELAGQQREKFVKLRKDFHTYAVGTCKLHGENARATDEDIRKTDDFFALEDFQRALLDRRFVEDEMLHTWVNEDRCDYYLRKVIQFYTEHGDAPCAQQVVERAREMLKYQEIADRLNRDRETKISGDGVSLKSGPFFRHWLNTGFYQARDPQSGLWLLDYLNQELPYLPEWSKGFLGAAEGKLNPRRVNCVLGSDIVEVCFHLRYMEFLLNGEPVYRPCLEWGRVARLTDADMFFFCLPVTVTTYDQYGVVKAEILDRLRDTAAPEDGRPVIAACLAGQVCSLPLPGEAGQGRDWDGEEPPQGLSLPPESILPFALYAEDMEHLYVCEWMERSQVLLLSEQLPIGRQPLKDGQCNGVADADSAIGLAGQMLGQTLEPPRYPMELLVNLPDAVYAMPDVNVVCREQDVPPLWGKPMELSGKAAAGEEKSPEDGTAGGETQDRTVKAVMGEGGQGLPEKAVTRGRLEELLIRFAGGWLERLELSWDIAPPIGEEQDYPARRSLVFLKGGGGYACLYFDDFRAKSYALLERPELYGKLKTNIELVPFRQGKLFHQVIHRSFSSILGQLDVIFPQVSWPNNVKFMAGGIWDYAVNVSYGRSKYNLDKQLLAGFPMERAHNRQDAPFYFLVYPVLAACTDEQGGAEVLEVGPADGGRLQQMLIRFLKGGFRKLRLTWGKETGRRRHIVLLQEGGRFLMAWLQEEKRTVEYHVADVGTYMDVEGKKYPKGAFQGRVIPSYLIHESAMELRNALELLLAHLDNPEHVTGRMAEYAGEKPVKPRPYEVLRAELIGDTSV